ncbi:MAG: polymer-forming cytoskeletal protein [Treponema sp.]|jgi:cytoskeletal protein CcmA (bactofilin family)|nr:polymer-forming cytoskeletal protein [Treponema sp.]
MSELRNDVLEDGDFDTILSQDIEFDGTINFDKPFMIRGKVSGEIKASALLLIDEDAVLDVTTIDVPRVIIRGVVKSTLITAQKVEITAAGKLSGDIYTKEVSMEPGCVFNGRCIMEETF